MGGPLWIDAETPDPIGAFAAAMDAIGSAGSPDEQGIFAAYAALEVQTDANAGFFRPDAALHVITVSDAADETPDSAITPAEGAPRRARG